MVAMGDVYESDETSHYIHASWDKSSVTSLEKPLS